MKKNRREIFVALSNISHFGLNIAISFLLWILIASWVKRTFHLGNFVMVIGIFLGLGSAALSLIKFCKDATGEDKNEH